MFCNQCGAKQPVGAGYCNACGSPMAQGMPQDSLGGGGAAIGMPWDVFTQRVFSIFKGRHFAIGVWLFVLGHGITLFSGFSAATVIALILPVVLAVGLLRVYYGAFKENALAILDGLGILKVATIIVVVLICIVLVPLGLLLLFAIFSGALATGLGIFLFILLLLPWVLMLRFYPFAFLKAIKCIRQGLLGAHVAKLEGAGSFVILGIIMSAFALVGSLALLGLSHWAGNNPHAFELGISFWEELGIDMGYVDVPTFRFSLLSFLGNMMVPIGYVFMYLSLRQLAKEVEYHGILPPPPSYT